MRILVTGPHGSGKTSLILLIRNLLEKMGVGVVYQNPDTSVGFGSRADLLTPDLIAAVGHNLRRARTDQVTIEERTVRRTPVQFDPANVVATKEGVVLTETLRADNVEEWRLLASKVGWNTVLATLAEALKADEELAAEAWVRKALHVRQQIDKFVAGNLKHQQPDG